MNAHSKPKVAAVSAAQAPTGKTKGNPTAEYDVIIVGSSPMSLVEASYRAGKGDKVCLIEASSRLGGAWAVEDCLGLSRIETSPHVFMPDETANAVMKTFLPSEYEDLPDQPKLMIRWSKYFGDFKLIKMSQRYREGWILNVIQHYEQRKGNRLVRFWNAFYGAQKIWAYRRKHKQTCKLIYPKYGLAVWLDDIEAHLKLLGVEILKNTRINEIRVDGKFITLIDADGQQYKPAQFAYSQMLHIDKFIYNGDEISLSYEDDTSQHIVYIVKGISPTKTLPFWRLMKDGYYMFFNDITRYSLEFREKYPGCRLINTRLYAYRAFTPSQLKTYFAHLSFVGYLPRGAKMVDWHYRYYSPKKLAYAEGYRLKKMLGPNAYELRSGVVGLHNGFRSTYGKLLRKK